VNGEHLDIVIDHVPKVALPCRSSTLL